MFVENYRPIAITSNFANAFEIALHKHLEYHVRPYLSDNRQGFIPGRSKATNLLTVSSFISK